MPDRVSANSRDKAISCVVLGVAIFLVCSIIQATNGTSMFDSTYSSPVGTGSDILINATWWPGWVASIVCVLRGIIVLVKSGPH